MAKAVETVTVDIGEWRVTMEFGSTSQGGPERLVIEPASKDAPPPVGISSSLLRKINFAEAVAAARLNRAPAYESDLKQLRAVFDAEGVSDRYLALLAAEYLALVDAGTKQPNELIADALGKSAVTVRAHLTQARNDRGILEGRPGRLGGVLTDRGRALLEG